MDNLSNRAQLLREVFRRFAPGAVRDLTDEPDAVRVRLRDGRMYLARLDREGGVRLEEIEVVC